MVFPAAPGLGRAQLFGRIVAGQAPVVGRDQVAALFGRDGRHVFFPAVGKQPRRAFLVEPLHFGAPQPENPAHHQFADMLRVGLRVSQRQGRAPRAAEHQPALGAHHFGAQVLDVGHQVPGGVVLQAGVRQRAAAAALVEQQHVVAARVEQLAVHRRAAAARAAMQEYRRLALRVAAQLPIDLVAVAGIA
ncbi:Uncharacterised protein [Bordetella pertussis]|nr:Uncharacterised protein [Bordetella pertussis]